ncbi:helix-turn-helix domain-containing protein [Gordonia pseudamarae]|jgi:transcriptional regulator with XRE-family HTH domain|uniref:Helix-turn-helix domain-containing protein n=1 Tax=Gordonia pseudamarae TaxID=2831662 RepID=A0ABX6IKG1_9ACTN|nr:MULTISPECIES: helix-turn-helix transcriptional regulator [Gordonia]MBD0023122.1 helix-turn-helix domain-containing protein [Gordonia sp. (in: high G+C Gram-positive bacteria)]QHN27253.1 helix-turn-helix domain-containing protein [Gordonia pseudamarae]QHN36136.1 helix-turn-helix domain-containing protein [Gordonia pseudamarae]
MTGGDIGEFLRSRRAAVSPEDAGFAVSGRRRVPGLRREEVALLANVSVDYYNRIERGQLAGVSDQVLEAIAGALRLDEFERRHLLDLVDQGRAGILVSQRTRSTTVLRPSVRAMVEQTRGVPCFVQNSIVDILAINPLMLELYRSDTPNAGSTANYPRELFLNRASKDSWWDWDQRAWETTAMLRYAVGRYPVDEDLNALIADLNEQSPEFRQLWASHEVSFSRSGTKLIRHPVVGDVEVDYEAMELGGDEGLLLFVYSASPGSAGRAALDRLEAAIE